MILTIALMVLILVLMMPGSFQIFANTTSPEPKQQQKLVTLPSNTNNSIGDESALLSPSPSTMNIHPNVQTDFNPNITVPVIQETAHIHPFATLIGNCYIGKLVLVAPTAVCRGDEGTSIYVGDHSNMQDGVILHGLATTEDGNNIDGRKFSSIGDRLMANSSEYADGYSVFVGTNTSLAHDSMVHGPAWIGNHTFVGMESIIFDAKVGNNVAIGISSTISNGVSVPDNKFVPPGSVILDQKEADELPIRKGSPYEDTNQAVLHVNKQLAEGYNTQLDLSGLADEREKQMENGMLETGMSDHNRSIGGYDN